LGASTVIRRLGVQPRGHDSGGPRKEKRVERKKSERRRQGETGCVFSLPIAWAGRPVCNTKPRRRETPESLEKRAESRVGGKGKEGGNGRPAIDVDPVPSAWMILATKYFVGIQTERLQESDLRPSGKEQQDRAVTHSIGKTYLKTH